MTESPRLSSTVFLSHFFEIEFALFCVASADGTLIWVNKTWETVLEYKPQEMVGHPMTDFLDQGEEQAVHTALFELADGNAITRILCRYISKSGQRKYLELRAQISDGLIYIWGQEATGQKDWEEVRPKQVRAFEEGPYSSPVVRPINNGEQRRTVESDTALNHAEQSSGGPSGLLTSLLDSIPDMVFYKDTEGVYLGCNPAYSEFFRQPKEAIVGKTDYELFDSDTARRMRAKDLEVYHSGKAARFEEWFDFGEGNKSLRETLKAPYIDAHGKTIGIIGISRDISVRKRREEEIRFLSFHDQLTGLYNRRFYEEELSRLNVERNLPITIIIGDVNSLKFVNDAFGHREGDVLIRNTAQAIKNSCRAEDIVARTGGDEFVLVFPKTDYAAAQNVLGRINAHLAEEEVGMMHISVSFGCATKTNKSQNIQDIIKKAEDRMYRNKLARRCSVGGKAVDTIIGTFYEKNLREMKHSKRVGELCESIALYLGLDQKTVGQVKLAGVMHDIGKVDIDEKILNKQDELSESERRTVNTHPEMGYRILSTSTEFSEIAQYVYQHHENWDGSGYPKGLKGEEILLPARIIAVAETYDAMYHPVYKEARTKQEIIREIQQCAGTKFDPAVVKAFVGVCTGERPRKHHL